MRIHAFDSTAFGGHHNWVFDTMTKEDAIDHLMGLAEIDVIVDEIADKKPIQKTNSGKTEFWIQRRIRGRVVRRLRLWEEKSCQFGKNPILGGVSLPEEQKVYMTGQVSVSYDEAENILEILAADTLYE
jgi:hypothetical protein